MSITIEIEPSVEMALKQKADAAGISLEKYASQLLTQEVNPSTPPLHPKVLRSLEMLKSFRGKVGPIPEDALRPDLLYGE